MTDKNKQIASLNKLVESLTALLLAGTIPRDDYNKAVHRIKRKIKKIEKTEKRKERINANKKN